MKWFGRQLSRQKAGEGGWREGKKKYWNIKTNSQEGEKKARNNFCLKNSACFILRLRNCTVDFMVFTALSKRKMLARATSGSIQHPGFCLKTQGTGVLSLAHTHLVKYFYFQQRCDSSCYWICSVQVTGSEIAMAPKGLTLMLESPYNFRLGLQRLLFLTGIFFWNRTCDWLS